MVKKDIRKIYIQKRNELDSDEVAAYSEKILDNFRALSLQGIQNLMSYYPIPERREFDTTLCEQLLRLENDLLNVYWPRLLADEVTMEAVLKNDDTPMRLNKFNIKEPMGDEVIDPQLIDAVFVPLLAFDVQGYRVGYGKGYYDRFLARCAQDVVKIGFSYFPALEGISDIDEFDVPLNYCITPERVYEF